ncbi:MAG TPA: pyruvate:ferredoxin (flavodoxin) oxidoreductase [Acidimicrobiia bacterium]|nr:pyruvate:ferredoxin (flavodoxin) oxidoreductase [Acidimicrobiia bacterium]
MHPPTEIVDGNEAAAMVAYAATEVIAIYPITPASPMGEYSDAWSMAGRPNLWGVVPEVMAMQSEGGAAGAVHGALQAGALTTTFTASQGLLLMLPNMFKIAGELSPMVIHVAARTIATHALSIFGDHSDVMAARQTGFAMLASNSPQEAHDLALIAHAATLRARVPFLHFFDGFRTSHEIRGVQIVPSEAMREMLSEELIIEHRLRSLNPQRPVIRGTAQNPDVFFQAREASNRFHAAVPDIVAAEMDRFGGLTGRQYRLFEYVGHPAAERIVVIMGSGAGAVREYVAAATAAGEKIGAVVVRLYRPFDAARFAAVVPDSVTSIAVLDRTKEPGAVGEPLYLDVVTALVEQGRASRIEISGGRYGLSSKEFTPAMVAGVFADRRPPAAHFTVGIIDDVTHTSIAYDRDSWHEPDDVMRAVFYGLGSDGTVGANKNSVRIVGGHTPLHAQGYFVYDSKKSGSQTVSHLRFSPRPIESTYLIDEPTFVACHQFDMLDRVDLLNRTVAGSTLLLNSPFGAADVWEHLSPRARKTIVDRRLKLFVVDAERISAEAGLGKRVNTVLQACFFALTDLLEIDDAVAAMKTEIEHSYGKRGETVVRRNHAVIDQALAALEEVNVPDSAPEPPPPVAAFRDAPDFVQRVTALLMAGEGDRLAVSALPVDGTFPTGTTKYEKRTLAAEIPIWDPDICIDCARCALACPHAAIRLKSFLPESVEGAPGGFAWKEASGRDLAGKYLTIQVAPDDCTGCGVCVDVCPAVSKEVAAHKAINMTPISDHLERERVNFDYFLTLPSAHRRDVNLLSVKGTQLIDPLFEFSGACAGCGETPYLKLMTQMFGDRVLIANATGCSSIYGGNLPTTPWSTDAAGRGPAWANSLFEDNAEFGLGMRLAIDQMEQDARLLVTALIGDLGSLGVDLLEASQETEDDVAKQRDRVGELRVRLGHMDGVLARRLESVADGLVRTGVWIVGGDGWAYDIGFGGLDHVLASGRDVNILVLDTEVYSNTGGQASKATPRAAVAKFAAGGKSTGKKDLGQIAMSYGNVFVAQVAMGANMTQTVRAFAEAERHRGVSLILAYSPCIAHGIDMATQMSHQGVAADSGYWPLFRYDPAREAEGKPGLRLDSRTPTIPFSEFARSEARFAMLRAANPEHAEALLRRAQQDIDDRWNLYEQMVEIHRTAEYGEVAE